MGQKQVFIFARMTTGGKAIPFFELHESILIYFLSHISFLSNADRRGSGIHTDELISWASSLRSECCSMFVTTVYIGSKLDSDAQVLPLEFVYFYCLTHQYSRRHHILGKE